jgi:hypothetical protein
MHNGTERSVTRVLGIRARGDFRFHLPLQVIAQFFIEFLLDFLAIEERPKFEAKNAGKPRCLYSERSASNGFTDAARRAGM